jgi:hypothetical protein
VSWICYGACALISVAALCDDARAAGPDAIITAAEVARENFETQLAKDTSEWKYASYVKDVENYDIGISQNQNSYVVVFILRKRGTHLKGGGGEYHVDKTTLRITRFKGYE